LIPRRPGQHPHAGRAFGGEAQQRRLADARLATQHHGAALGSADGVQQLLDRGTFGFATKQSGKRRIALERAHVPIVNRPCPRSASVDCRSGVEASSQSQ